MFSRNIPSILLLAGMVLSQVPSAYALSGGLDAVQLRGYLRAERMTKEQTARPLPSSSSSSSSSAAVITRAAMRIAQRKASAAGNTKVVSSAKSSATTTETLDIGLKLLNNTGFIYVTVIDAYSAADKAGVRAGDTIDEIDGKKITATMATEEVLSRLNGPKDTVVKVVVGRQNAGQKSISILRAQPEPPPAFILTQVGDAVLLKLSSFKSADLATAEAAVRNLGAQNTQKVVLDLRDTPQDSIEDMLNVIGLFVPKGTKVGFLNIMRNDKGVSQGIISLFTKREPLFGENTNLVVLVGGSHDASIRLICYGLYKTDNFHVVEDASQIGRRMKGSSTFIASNGKQFELVEFSTLNSRAMVDLTYSASLKPIMDALVSPYMNNNTDNALEKALSYVR